MTMKPAKLLISLMVLIPALTHCVGIQSTTTEMTHALLENSSGEKKLEFKRRSFTIESHTTEEILDIAEKKTGRKYVLLCDNDCIKYHTIRYESKLPYKPDVFEKMVELMCRNENFILTTATPAMDIVLYDSSFVYVTSEVFSPDILLKMGLEDEKGQDLKYSKIIKSVNNKYLAWNYSINDFRDYYYDNNGGEVTNATTYDPDQNLHFEYHGKPEKSEGVIHRVTCLCDSTAKDAKSNKVTQRLLP